MPRSFGPACHTMFSTVRAFEMHRTGQFQADERRCLTSAEMRARGMTQNARGDWMVPDVGKVPFWTQETLEEVNTS